MGRRNSIGAIIAVLAVFFALGIGLIEATGLTNLGAYDSTIAIVLIIAGLVLGFMNIKSAESVPFMVSALVIAGGATALATLPTVGTWLQVIFEKIALLVAPAAVTVALFTAYKRIIN